MCLTEYDEERVLKGIAEELREDLREEVKEEVRTEVRTEYEQKLADKDAEIARQANKLEAMRKLLAAQTKTTVNN